MGPAEHLPCWQVVGYDSQTGNHAASQGYSSGGGFKNYPTPLSPGRYGASAPPPTEDFSALTLGYGIAGANTSSYSTGVAIFCPQAAPCPLLGLSCLLRCFAPLSHSTAPSSQNFGSGGGSGAPYSASNGGYVMDPNYGGSQDYAAPSNTSYQPVAVTGYDGYDVFSQGPDQPAKNYPSMQATVRRPPGHQGLPSSFSCLLPMVFSRIRQTFQPTPSSPSVVVALSCPSSSALGIEGSFVRWSPCFLAFGLGLKMLRLSHSPSGSSRPHI